ncbi:MAG TPA: hypothetical protein VFC19_04960 [Candidatus Limnocylindrales bacterium]|nr:hypothetical protein [Candidatus Limnocylindrales bacterium]
MDDALTRRLAEASAQVAAFCDAMEHVELAERRDIASAAEAMLDVAREVWSVAPQALAAAAIARLRKRIAKRSPEDLAAFDAVVADAPTLASVRAAVNEHDSLIEPDFVGRPRMDQLRHLSYTGPKLLAKALTASADPELDKVAVELTLLGVRLLAVVRMPLPYEGLAPLPQAASGPRLASWSTLDDLPDGSIVYRPRSQDVLGAIFDRELFHAAMLSSRSHMLRLAANAFVVWPRGSQLPSVARLGVCVDAASRPAMSAVCGAAFDPLHPVEQGVLDLAGKVAKMFEAGWRYEPDAADGIIGVVGESMRRTLMLLRSSVANSDAHGASAALGWLGWVPVGGN